jgi:hypothetical protein
MARVPWPIPALLVWSAAWGLYWLTARVGVSAPVPLVLAAATGVLLSLAASKWWRRAIIALGFPVSLALSGTSVLPAWGWLVLLVSLALIYPLNAWRDAPLFPTPAKSLRSLAKTAPLPEGALLLDAGCGLGHGLSALRDAYPKAQLHGIEWSWPLRAMCGLRCPWAHVRQGDIWRADWSPYVLVYLFQRPESMGRAVVKAGAEMAAGSWLVSLEFEARELLAEAAWTVPDGRPLWLYRLPFVTRKRIDVAPQDK